jgi:hypothetical protein
MLHLCRIILAKNSNTFLFIFILCSIAEHKLAKTVEITGKNSSKSRVFGAAAQKPSQFCR